MLELINFQQATASITRIEELLRLPSEQIHEGAVDLLAGPLAVTFDDVSFRYNISTPEPTLQEISFHLQPGTVMGGGWSGPAVENPR